MSLPFLLPTLPNRFPDEWYVSYIFRLHLLTGMPTVEHSIKHIFGERIILSHITPTGIAELAARIPRKAKLSVDVLLMENTVFPYLRAFAFEYTEQEYRERYVGGEFFKPSSPTAAAGSRLDLGKRQPRFCIHCLRDDEKKWGIAYFHRTHQVPETTVCVEHGTTLRSHCTNCGPLPWPQYGIWPAGECRKCGADLSAQGASNLVHSNYLADLRIAQLITQFLDAKLPLFDISTLQETYRKAFGRNGFLTYNNTLSSRKFANAAVERFGEKFMREIHMPPRDRDFATPIWSQRILRKNPSTRPLEHCVIIFFLFGSFDNFIEAYAQNATSAGQHEAFFASIAVYAEKKTSTVAWRRSQEVPVPVPVMPPVSRTSAVSDYTLAFQELFLAGKSKNSIAKITNQKAGRVEKYAKQNPELEVFRSELCYQIKFDAHKKKLQSFFGTNPKGSFQKFRRFSGTRDDWLERNEPDWLNQQFEAREKIELPSDDQKHRHRLEQCIVAEYDATECRRITIGRMRTELKIAGMMLRPKNEYPLFWEMLDTYLETRDEFVARRVKTAFDRRTEEYLTISSLLALAGIPKNAERVAVAKAVAEELLRGGNWEKFLRMGPLTPT